MTRLSFFPLYAALVYRLKDQDRAKYAAIGESDRFTLKFVRP